MAEAELRTLLCNQTSSGIPRQVPYMSEQGPLRAIRCKCQLASSGPFPTQPAFAIHRQDWGLWPEFQRYNRGKIKSLAGNLQQT